MSPVPSRISQVGATLLLDFDDQEAIAAFFEEAESQVGFLLALERELKLFTRCTLTARAGDFRFDFEAEVIQAFPGPGESVQTAFQLADWAERRPELNSLLGLPAKPPTAETAAQSKPAGDESETLGTSPIFRIKQLNPNEKARLAIKADRTERQILLRDNTPQVLMALLNNPHVEESDVLEIVKSVHTTGALLKRIAEDRRWMSSYDIQLAVVRNPKTPTPIATRMLDSLHTRDLAVFAKSSSVREVIRRAALRIYERRK